MATIKSEWIVETGSSQTNIENLIGSVERYKGEIGTVGDLNRSTFRESAAAVIDYNKQLANGTKIYQGVENSAKGFDNELKRLKAVYQDLIKNQKQFIAEGRYEELQKNIAGVKNRMKELGAETGKTSSLGGGLSGMMGEIGGALAIGGVVATVISLGKSIFTTTAEFQKFDAVLTTSLGSDSAAQRAMLMLQDTAAKTPFSVQELTDSYVKLASRGIRATAVQIEALGDLASSTGKSFDQLTEAVLDSLSGENERLKEFGVTAKKTGETTQFTFKGVTTEVKNTKEAVLEYMLSLGKMDGVAGSSAAISKTLNGQISNLGDSFDQLFLTLGNQQEGIFGNTISLINGMVAAVTTLISSTDQLGEKIASKGVSKFALEVELDMKDLAKKTVQAGGDVEAELKKQADMMKEELEWNQVVAQQKLDKFREENGGLLNKAGELLDRTGTKYTSRRLTESILASDVANAKGKQGAIDDAVRFALEGEQALQNALEAAKDLKNKEAQKKQIELDKKAGAARKKALAELAKQLADLEKEAGKARIDAMDKNSREYLDAVMKSELANIQKVEDELIAASKAAGKGGQLGDKQKEQLSVLRNVVYDERNAGLLELEQTNAEKLFNLQKDSEAKQLQSIENRYAKEIAAAKKAKNEVLAQALEKAKGLELAEAKLAQASKKLDTEEALKVATIEVGAFEYSADDSAVEIEKKRQQAILDVQIEYARKRMALAMAEGTEDGKIRALNLQKLINDLQGESIKLNTRKPFNMLDLLGVKEEDREDVKKAFGEVVSMVTDFTAERLEAANALVDQRKEDVESAEEDLNTEIELNKLGFASNVEAKRAELEEKKKAEAQAIEEQKKAQRAQMAIDSIAQISNLVTASTSILKGFALIPIIGQALGIAAVAAMFGAFVSMKAKAMQSVKMEKGGLLGGERHSKGGNKYVSVDGNSTLEHEEGEFFVNRKSTAKRLEWLEAINKDDEAKLKDLAWQHVLEGTGVEPSKKTAKRAQAASSAYQTAKDTAAGKVSLKGVEKELKAINKNTKKQGLVFEDDSKKVYKFGNTTRTIRKR